MIGTAAIAVPPPTVSATGSRARGSARSASHPPVHVPMAIPARITPMTPVKVSSETPTYGASSRPASISSTRTLPDATNTSAPAKPAFIDGNVRDARAEPDSEHFPYALSVASQFVDECQLNVRGGDGGAGCVSFRREGPVAFGGPNGGDGGKGGDIWLVADHNVASLLAFRDHPHRRAESGVHGKGKDLHGRRGEDLVITVPEGTIVKDLYSGEVLAELLHHGDRWLAAAGGRGGRGNAKFLSN